MRDLFLLKSKLNILSVLCIPEVMDTKAFETMWLSKENRLGSLLYDLLIMLPSDGNGIMSYEAILPHSPTGSSHACMTLVLQVSESHVCSPSLS